MEDPWTHVTSLQEDKLEQLAGVLSLRGSQKDYIASSTSYFSLIREDFRGTSGPHRILEIGCGTGEITRLLAAEFPDSKVTGLDPSSYFLKIARHMHISPDDKERLHRAEYVEGTADALPFPDSTFRWVIMHTTLSHIPVASHAAVLREAYRVLGDNGKVVLFDNDICGSVFGTSVYDTIALPSAYLSHNVVKRDVFLCRKFPVLLSSAGFSSPQLSIAQVTQTEPGSYGLSIVERGVDAMVASGLISSTFGGQWKEEVKSRAKEGSVVISMSYATCIATKTGSTLGSTSDREAAAHPVGSSIVSRL